MDELPLSISSSVDFGALKSGLTCPICVNIPTGETRICNVGHHICLGCREETDICPFCRGDFADGARCWIWEDLIRTNLRACRFADFGCTRQLSLSNETHELNCAYRYGIFFCPLLGCQGCSMNTGVVLALIKHHLQTQHFAENISPGALPISWGHELTLNYPLPPQDVALLFAPKLIETEVGNILVVIFLTSQSLSVFSGFLLKKSGPDTSPPFLVVKCSKRENSTSGSLISCLDVLELRDLNVTINTNTTQFPFYSCSLAMIATYGTVESGELKFNVALTLNNAAPTVSMLTEQQAPPSSANTRRFSDPAFFTPPQSVTMIEDNSANNIETLLAPRPEQPESEAVIN